MIFLIRLAFFTSVIGVLLSALSILASGASGHRAASWQWSTLVVSFVVLVLVCLAPDLQIFRSKGPPDDPFGLA